MGETSVDDCCALDCSEAAVELEGTADVGEELLLDDVVEGCTSLNVCCVVDACCDVDVCCVLELC